MCSDDFSGVVAEFDGVWNIPNELNPSGYGGGKSNWCSGFSRGINGFCGDVGMTVDDETDDVRELVTDRSLRRNFARRFWNQTWTRDSVRATFCANSSRTNASDKNFIIKIS